MVLFIMRRWGLGTRLFTFVPMYVVKLYVPLSEFVPTKYVHVLEIVRSNFYHPNMYPSWKFGPFQEICTPSGNLCSKICTPGGNLYPKIYTPPENLYTKLKYSTILHYLIDLGKITSDEFAKKKVCSAQW